MYITPHIQQQMKYLLHMDLQMIKDTLTISISNFFIDAKTQDAIFGTGLTLRAGHRQINLGQ